MVRLAPLCRRFVQACLNITLHRPRIKGIVSAVTAAAELSIAWIV